MQAKQILAEARDIFSNRYVAYSTSTQNERDFEYRYIGMTSDLDGYMWEYMHHSYETEGCECTRTKSGYHWFRKV